MTTEQRIYREFMVMRRKRYGYRRGSRTQGDIRLALARKWRMSCRQIRIIVETEKALTA